MSIVPDTKDWTWVLRRPCPECGLDTGSLAREQIPALLRANVAAWRGVLDGREAADLRRRPRPQTWSPLEYACHVRDVFLLYAERLELMLTRDDPAFPDWNQDETAVVQRYGEQEPGAVQADLVRAGEHLATAFGAVPADGWARTGTRSDGAHFTVETFARYLLHDPVHHLYDVTGERTG
jgi:DinB superfamily